jgi:hypothetical protein
MNTRKILFAIVIAGLVFLTRIPFLDAGYGSDPDAWRMTDAARQMAGTGLYVPSRLPGYPLPEFSYTLLAGGHSGPLLQNGLTAILGAVGIAFFYLTLVQLGSSFPAPAAAALALTPAVYTQSATSMDYIWALGFMLAALFLAVESRPLTSGVLLGIAIGCRLTSAGMLIPLALLLIYTGERKKGVLRAIRFAIPALIIGAAFYIPVFMRFGLGFLTPAIAKPSLLNILRKAGPEAWGIIGFVGIVLILIVALGLRAMGKLKTEKIRKDSAWHYSAWIAGLVVYLLAFALMPHEAAYLIPAVPFVILLLEPLVGKRLFAVACLVLIISPFALGLYTAEQTQQFGNLWNPGPSFGFSMGGKQAFVSLEGPVLLDRKLRLAGMDYSRAIVTACKDSPPGTRIIVGYWQPLIQILGDGQTDTGKFVYSLSCDEIRAALAGGQTVYYLREAGVNNFTLEGCDPAEAGARPLEPLLHLSRPTD